MPRIIGRPATGEYAPYYERYIKLVPSDDLISYMTEQIRDVSDLFGAIADAKAETTYAPGKWTIKEVLGHVIDTERVFQYRALSFARRDPAALPGFDQDVWNPNAGFNDCSLKSLLAQWLLVRQGNIAFLESLPAGAEHCGGEASGNPFSVRALAYIPPGHVAYHMVILKERYL